MPYRKSAEKFVFLPPKRYRIVVRENAGCPWIAGVPLLLAWILTVHFGLGFDGDPNIEERLTILASTDAQITTTSLAVIAILWLLVSFEFIHEESHNEQRNFHSSGRNP